jgi:hypothetical protein
MRDTAFISLVSLQLLLNLAACSQTKPVKPVSSFKITCTGPSGYSTSATGFIVRKNHQYFLVTAKHSFIDNSTLAGYTLPSYDHSCTEVTVLNENHDTIAKQLLVESTSRTLLYRVYYIDSAKAIDVAALLLIDPPDQLKTNAVAYSDLLLSTKIDYAKTLRIEGFPSRTNTLYSINGNFRPQAEQSLLDMDGTYYYFFDAEVDLKGMSGGPIFLMDGKKKIGICGVMVGENRTYKTFGYGVFSFYVRKLIDSFQN